MALLLSGQVLAEKRYLSSETFLQQSFGDKVPAPKVIWMTAELKRSLTALTGKKPTALRLRYWQQDKRSVWVFNEVGKIEPITIALLVENGRIHNIAVLIFRESRGAEVRHQFFTQQYLGAALSKNQLNQGIDGITGATLSVNAMNRAAKQALFLHKKVMAKAH